AMTAVLELGGLDLKPGDEVLLSVLASDTFEHAGQVHEPVRSPARKLAIISTEEFVAQAWGELEQVRQGAMRIEEDQAQALDQARRADGAAELAQAQQAQGVLSERAAREREAVARLEARVRENRLTDAELRGVLDEAARLLDAGGRASNQAGEALGRAAEAEDGSPQRRAQQEEATRAQEEAREAAGDLAELLNRGQDTWAMRRALARLLEEQRRIRDETRELGQRTAGQSAQDLQPAERQALEQLAQDQAAAAAEAREALDTMNRRQEQLQERDPAAARAAQQAARRGEQDRLPQRLEEAAEQVRQNQTSSAGAQQDRAIKTLEEMLEDMEGAAGARDEALRRLLADLMDSIRALIDDQEAQLAALAARPEPESARGLDAGMIRLNQNTLAAADQARQEDQSGELGPVLELLGQAAEAQAGAVTSLRAQPIDLDRTRQQEELSLARLKRALEEAEKLDQDAAEREAARKTAELKKAYREALAEQVALQEQTVPLAGEEPSRRTRAQARSLAPRQESLRQTLARLREETEELSEAVVFDLAHDLLDELMAGAAAALGRGEAGPSVLRDQDSAAGVLRSLIESLERDRPGDEFDENEQGGGGGGGQPGKPQVVPPVAQLKLLRAMQARAMELTRRADESGDAALAGQAAALQRALAERGQSLLESLAPERPGEEPEAPQDDAPDADGDAEDQPSPEGGEE
ncbi:MAG TPA: hypothetical protein VD963_07410, partial [Phycisphaerales bacterium]|nr:hypothetical protein [Phycisphaerales bacterium]